MSERGGHGRGEAVAVTTRTMEIVVATIILVLGAIVVYDSYQLGAAWAEDGPQAGYFPFYVGLIVCACTAIVLVQAILGRVAGPAVFVRRGQLRQVMAVLIPAAIFVLGIQLIGIYVAAVVYITAFMVWIGRYPMARSLAIGLVVMTLFFLTFEVWFKVPLYKGLWDPLAFLGY